MFTGIVEEIGNVKSVNSGSIVVSCSKIIEDMKIGDSIAVDGVCLTVTSFTKEEFIADVSYETKKVTKLNDLQKGDCVNLERAMLATSRFGGHIVSGHVDCVGNVVGLKNIGEFFELEIKLPTNDFQQYMVKKGSVTIDGISLTIYDLTASSFKIAVIPHTFGNTNMKSFKIGVNVNVEFDILAKYVEKKLLMKDNKSNITKDFLMNNGFI